jgi:hypothetical protein
MIILAEAALRALHVGRMTKRRVFGTVAVTPSQPRRSWPRITNEPKNHGIKNVPIAFIAELVLMSSQAVISTLTSRIGS